MSSEAWLLSCLGSQPPEPPRGQQVRPILATKKRHHDHGLGEGDPCKERQKWTSAHVDVRDAFAEGFPRLCLGKRDAWSMTLGGID